MYYNKSWTQLVDSFFSSNIDRAWESATEARWSVAELNLLHYVDQDLLYKKGSSFASQETCSNYLRTSQLTQWTYNPHPWIRSWSILCEKPTSSDTVDLETKFDRKTHDVIWPWLNTLRRYACQPHVCVCVPKTRVLSHTHSEWYAHPPADDYLLSLSLSSKETVAVLA